MKKFKIQLGMFLVISLLLTSVLTATGIVLIKVTVTGKNVSESFVQVTTLLNKSAISAGIIEQAIDAAVAGLDSKANIYLVDISGTTKTIVKEPSTKADLSTLLFEPAVSQTTPAASGAASGAPTASSAIGSTPPKIHNSMQLKSATSQKGHFTQTHKRLSINDPTKPEQAQYKIKVSAYTCDDTTGGCQIVDKEINKQRSCPKSTNNKAMRPLLDNELTGLPPGTTNSYPNLYCTCADGSYTKTNADGSCSLGINCTANQYYNGTSCVNCASGYYSLGGQVTTCTACATGCANCSYTPRIGVRCTGCAPNYNGPDTFGSCTTCPVNNFYSGEVCIHCDPGSYSAGGKVTSCTSCSSITGCANCSYTPSMGVRCTSCAPNYNGPDTFGSCTTCPVNNFYSGEVCIPCDPGSYSAGGKVTQCTSCGTGCTACTTATQCTNCRAGFYLNSGVCNTCPSNATCNNNTITCNDNYYLNGSTCNACPDNATCSNNTISCNTGYNLRNNSCVQLCLTGASITGTGDAAYCSGLGTFKSASSSWMCNCSGSQRGNQGVASGGVDCYFPACAINHNYRSFCTRSNSTDSRCKCNSDTPLWNGSSCVACPAGTYFFAGNFISNSRCSACPTNCSSCTSSSNCTACNIGYSGSTCNICSAGYYLNNGSCSPCPDGSSSTAGSNNCVHCDSGTYARSGDSSCTPCPAGYYSEPHVASCYSMYDSLTTPRYPECPPGYGYLPTATYQGTSCSSCPAGSYLSPGTTNCIHCTAGTYAPSGASSCTPCPQGYYSEPNAANCYSMMNSTGPRYP